MTSPNGLPTLASIDDVAGRLPMPLSDAQATRAGYLLLDASSQIRRYCRKDFQFHENETDTFDSMGAIIKLPSRTNVTVTSVTAISGNDSVPDLPITWWTFDGIDEISVADSNSSGVINLPESWYELGGFPGTFQVVWTYGYPIVPDEVTMVCANAVISVLLAPTLAAGVIGETIGDYSYRMERGGGGLAVALTEADLAALSDFREQNSTISMRM